MIKNIMIRKKTLMFAFVLVLMILSLLTTIYASTHLTPLDGKAINRVTPSIEAVDLDSQFQVEIAYAYVGPLPLDKASYFDPKTNETMVHRSKYPSSVFLEFTPALSLNSSVDAVIEVYGVKIVADTGITEYYGWTVGTANYSVFTQDDFATINSYRGDMIHKSIYQIKGGTWCYNWAVDRSVLSKTIGSVGIYTTNSTFTQPSSSDLSSAGTPNAISVEVYRIGYITMTKGSVTIHEESETDNKPVAQVQLSKYQDGFICNNLVPTEQLQGIDLFHPQR